MHVLILTQWYPPEPLGLMEDLAAGLKAIGHEVRVLTGFPNYPEGRIFPGYSLAPWRREERAGVAVVRVALYPEHSRSGLRRALNYLSFAATSTLLGPWLLPRPDVIFVYHPPLTAGLPAWALGRIWRVPFVLQIQDMWPETLQATGMVHSRTVLRGMGRLARWLYDRAGALCVVSPGFRESLISKGVPPQKIHVISNWADGGLCRPMAPDPDETRALGLEGAFTVMYAGNMGQAQGLESVLGAAALLGDQIPVRFVLVGDGVALPALRETARRRGLSNVQFLGRRPQEKMARLYALADVLLIPLRDEPLFRWTIPHKLFAYMASGKPILAAVAGDAADIVRGEDAGIVCPPEDPKALAAAVRALYAMPAAQREEMGMRGLRAARTQYSREVSVGRIEELLRAVAEGAAPADTTRATGAFRPKSEWEAEAS